MGILQVPPHQVPNQAQAHFGMGQRARSGWLQQTWLSRCAMNQVHHTCQVLNASKPACYMQNSQWCTAFPFTIGSSCTRHIPLLLAVLSTPAAGKASRCRLSANINAHWQQLIMLLVGLELFLCLLLPLVQGVKCAIHWHS